MAGITLAEAEAGLAEWQAALSACTANQSYTIGDRTLTRANLKDIRDTVDWWDKKVKELDRGGARVRLATPV